MADIRSLEMPKWGMTMEEGTLTKWLFSEGDSVSEGDVLAEAESSKLTGEIESPMSGKLARILVSEGETVAVAAALAVLADSSASDAEIDQFVADLGGSSAGASAQDDAAAAAPAETAQTGDLSQESEELPSTQKAAAESDPGRGSSPQGGTSAEPSRRQSAVAQQDDAGQADSIPDSLRGSDSEEVAATPHAAKLAEKHGIALSQIEATGRGNRVTVADLQKAVADAGGHLSFGNTLPRKGKAAITGDDSAVDATVHARKLAEEEGVNLLAVRASGRNGRVTLADVQAWLALNRAPEPAAASAPAAAASSSQSQQENPATEIPLTTMRRVIGSRLKESYSDSPHFRVTAEAKLDRLLAFRREVNDHRVDLKLSVNDLVTTAVSRALKKVPEVNAQFDGETIRQFDHADISVAVATEEGLITPIVRAADTLSPGQISEQITDLATRAKAGTLKPDEFQGGTFTISNLGMFGITNFDAIINPPQVAILAVGGAQKRFVPDSEGKPVAATVLEFTLSADHRVVDGATSARFCKELKSLLETPALIFA